MCDRHRDRINLAIGIFAALFVASLFLRANFFYARAFAQFLAVSSLVPFVAAFWLYMETKGRPGAWGLLALIPVAGVILLLLVPARTTACPTHLIVPAPAPCDGPHSPPPA
jgi:hypothetical protein